MLDLIQVKTGDVAVDNRQNFVKLAEALNQSEGSYELPTWHYVAPGLYGRRCFMAAGSCVVSRIHKYEHITAALTGSCVVVDADGNKVRVVAPHVWVTKPGTQRALLVEEDSEWLTIHAAEVKDPEDMKDILTCVTHKEFEDFVAALPAPEDV